MIEPNANSRREFPLNLAAIVLGITGVLLVGPLRAEPADYVRDVKPLLKRKCYSCHAALKQEANLRLDTATSMRAGGDSGVRFVQLFNGAYASGGVLNWDGHQKLREQYDGHGEILDQPAAALFNDLKQRGLLEETLVLWCTEFGRMPMFQKGAQGRDHNPEGFTAWLGGAGIKPGVSFGSTDELGFKAVENVLSVHDLNATVLHLLGLDHTRLTFQHNGIERRLTDVHGHVISAVLSDPIG